MKGQISIDTLGPLCVTKTINDKQIKDDSRGSPKPLIPHVRIQTLNTLHYRQKLEISPTD